MNSKMRRAKRFRSMWRSITEIGLEMGYPGTVMGQIFLKQKLKFRKEPTEFAKKNDFCHIMEMKKANRHYWVWSAERIIPYLESKGIKKTAKAISREEATNRSTKNRLIGLCYQIFKNPNADVSRIASICSEEGVSFSEIYNICKERNDRKRNFSKNNPGRDSSKPTGNKRFGGYNPRGFIRKDR